MQTSKLFAYTLFGVATLATRSMAAETYTVYSAITTTGDYDFSDNDPVETPDFILKLRAQAEIAAKMSCTLLYGPGAIVQRTGESPIEESILHLSLPVSWLCSREIQYVEEIVPSLITALTAIPTDGPVPQRPYFSYGLADLAEIVPDILVNTGDPGAVATVAAVSDPTLGDDSRETVVGELGTFLASSGIITSGVRDDVRTKLDDLLSGDALRFSYYAAAALAKETDAATYAVGIRGTVPYEAYGALVEAISSVQKLPSYNVVPIAEFDYLLSYDQSTANEYALLALDSRGMTPAELEQLLPKLAHFADPKSTAHSGSSLVVLEKYPGPNTAAVVVNAIDSSLLDSAGDERFLYQAMTALLSEVGHGDLKAALPALHRVAASNVNPDNHYLQDLATRLISVIGG